MKDDKRGDKKTKEEKEEQEKQGGNAAEQQAPISEKAQTDKRKDLKDEQQDRSEFLDWGNPMGESSDPGNQGKGI